MATQPAAQAAPSHKTSTPEETHERSTHLAFNAFVALLILALLAVAWTFLTL
jgi:hypothetical protein